MASQPRRPLYPIPAKGPLSEDTSSYGITVEPKGPKMGNTQGKLMIFGVVFFILFTALMAFFFGITDYL